MALRRVLTTKPPTPYFKPPSIKITVLAIKEVPKVVSWDFTNNMATPAVTKKNLTAAISDGYSVAKVTLYEEFAAKIKEGGSYFLRGYTLRGAVPPYFIFVTRETAFFTTSPVAVTESLRAEALLLLDPQSEETQLSEVAGAGGLITVEGVVTDLSPVRKFTKSDQDVPMRSLSLKQNKDEVRISLWREAAVLDVVLGGTVRFTHLRTSMSARGLQLHSTTFTTVESVSESIQVEVQGVIEATGISKTVQLLLTDDSTVEIATDLWQPYQGKLEQGNLIFDLKLCGNSVKEISLREE